MKYVSVLLFALREPYLIPLAYSKTAISSFITYLAQEGYSTDLKWFTQVELWVRPYGSRASRFRLMKVNRAVTPQQSAQSLQKTLHSTTATRCSPFNSMLQAQTMLLLSLKMVTLSWTVSTPLALDSKANGTLDMVDSIVNNSSPYWDYG